MFGRLVISVLFGSILRPASVRYVDFRPQQQMLATKDVCGSDER